MKVSAEEEMLRYMEEKYGEEFEIISKETQTWSAGYSEMKVRSEKFPDASIIVRKTKETGNISDNYVDFLMKEPIEQEFQSIVSQVYDNFKAIYSPGGTTLPEKAKPGMTVSEYSKVKNTPMTIQIAVEQDSSNKDELVEKLRALLEEKQYRSELYIFYMLNGKLAELDDSNANELFNGATGKNWASLRGDFSMDRDYQFRTARWRELQ
ncbi:hypothetical protein AM500_02950 [Bacillus sp. FJAT-18017]|uniref:hypothetical protein n=1 Tax=Bacillus sp. FJAT-18017 TaxID=1705566 RepID=UPI0006AE7CF4|nr:hypothetical protein [Bacillus sp. FJAT-18017]ALC88871.1 hypothetical protein AM500_02950 [Bacillus sp. FJAT-18017]